jgi:hypothetical protein
MEEGQSAQFDSVHVAQNTINLSWKSLTFITTPSAGGKLMRSTSLEMTFNEQHQSCWKREPSQQDEAEMVRYQLGCLSHLGNVSGHLIGQRLALLEGGRLLVFEVCGSALRGNQEAHQVPRQHSNSAPCACHMLPQISNPTIL